MKKLLDALEQYGFKDPDGHLLTNCREWHELRQRLAHGVLLETADMLRTPVGGGLQND